MKQSHQIAIWSGAVVLSSAAILGYLNKTRVVWELMRHDACSDDYAAFMDRVDSDSIASTVDAGRIEVEQNIRAAMGSNGSLCQADFIAAHEDVGCVTIKPAERQIGIRTQNISLCFAPRHGRTTLVSIKQ